MTTTLPHDQGGADDAPPDPTSHAEAVAPSEGDGRGAPVATPDPALGEAAARLHAWRALREGAGGSSGGGPAGVRDPDRATYGGRAAGAESWLAVERGDEVGAPWADAAGENEDGDEDEVAARLRARRSARHVAAAYTAAHGHLADRHDDGTGARRWSLALRAAVVASVVVLLVAVVVAVVATARPDDVITLAGGGAPSSAASSGPSSPSAGPSAAAPSAAGPVGLGAEGETGEAPEAVPAPGTVVVHVVGEVREPGLVTVPSGARVADAVAAAGGTTRRADAAALNLARAVVDGEQIRVPRPGEPVPATGGGSAGALEGGAEGTEEASPGGAVNLNAAPAAELEELPGIGPALAERIIAWRDENGPFTSVDELDEVSGIGPSVLGQVRDMVTL
ncbi:ComEA family DNA-binding protein [Isoptericola sp. NPDC019693]|uniref:ComEA family DNA-binding protein n=1 Tax=Isoptericola sp. NPDC019693 TaxID=3364009 RepID=UPI003790E511